MQHTQPGSICGSDQNSGVSVYSNQMNSQNDFDNHSINPRPIPNFKQSDPTNFMSQILNQLAGTDQIYSPNNTTIEVHETRRTNLTTQIEALRKSAGVSTSGSSNENLSTHSNHSKNSSSNSNKNYYSDERDKRSDVNSNFSSGISADMSYNSSSVARSMCQDNSFNSSSGIARSSSYAHSHYEPTPSLREHIIPVQNISSDWQRFRISQQCVNNLEAELEVARTEYRNMMIESGEKLKEEARNLGSCVEKARPLFDAQRSMRRIQNEVQNASISYKRAQNLKDAAKQMVTSAELKVKECEKMKASGREADQVIAWLEQLNQSNENYQLASKTAASLAARHSKYANEFLYLQTKVAAFESKGCVKYLDTARPYFNLQLDLWSNLEQQGALMVRLEASLDEARSQLSAALQDINLNSQKRNNSSRSASSRSSSRNTSFDSISENCRKVIKSHSYASNCSTPRQIKKVLHYKDLESNFMGNSCKNVELPNNCFGRNDSLEDIREYECREEYYDGDVEEILKPSKLFPDDGFRGINKQNSVHQNFQTSSQSVNFNGLSHTEADPTTILASIGFYDDMNINRPKNNILNSKSLPVLPKTESEFSSSISRKNNPYSLVMIDQSENKKRTSSSSTVNTLQNFHEDAFSTSLDFEDDF